MGQARNNVIDIIFWKSNWRRGVLGQCLSRKENFRPAKWAKVRLAILACALLGTGCSGTPDFSMTKSDLDPTGPCPDLSGRYGLSGTRTDSAHGRTENWTASPLLWSELPADQGSVIDTLREAFADTSYLSAEQVASQRQQGRLYPAESKTASAYVDLVRQDEKTYFVSVHFSNGMMAGSYRVRMDTFACLNNMYYVNWQRSPNLVGGDPLFTRNFMVGEQMIYREHSGNLVIKRVSRIRGVGLGFIRGATEEWTRQTIFPRKP